MQGFFTAVQTPAALHSWTLKTLPAEQLVIPLPQRLLVVALRQAPLPLHWSKQSACLHPPFGSGEPAVTLVQVPCIPRSVHDLHAPVHAVLQQTLSTQLPLEQSAALPHLAPISRFPHEPALQTVPPEHCVSLPQVPRQLLPLHPLKGLQL